MIRRFLRRTLKGGLAEDPVLLTAVEAEASADKAWSDGETELEEGPAALPKEGLVLNGFSIFFVRHNASVRHLTAVRDFRVFVDGSVVRPPALFIK